MTAAVRAKGRNRAAARIAMFAAVALVAACTAVERDASPSDTAVVGAVADGGSGDSAVTPSVRVDLTGAGATFPYPLYARWFNEYAVQSNVRINYRSVGSASGIAELITGRADFGATDVPMTDEELAAAPAPVVHVPTALGAVAITYNLPALTRPLRLSGDVIADIFLGRISRWDDARLRALNPDAPLGDEAIHVVHRSDGSGTSYIMSDYLSAVSPRWAAGPGRGRRVTWPAGKGSEGNEGVAGAVKQQPGSIGYLEVVYARQNHLRIAHVRNRAGRFRSPMPFEIASASTSALAGFRQADGGIGSASSGGTSAPDLRVSIVDAPGEHAYPLASFTWMLLSPSSLGPVKTRQLTDFLRWALLDGSTTAAELGYVALPTEEATQVLDHLDAFISRRPVVR